MEKYNLVSQAIDNNPLNQFKKFKFWCTHLLNKSANLLQATTDWIVETGDFNQPNKIVDEEDKGASGYAYFAGN